MRTEWACKGNCIWQGHQCHTQSQPAAQCIARDTSGPRHFNLRTGELAGRGIVGHALGVVAQGLDDGQVNPPGARGGAGHGRGDDGLTAHTAPRPTKQISTYTTKYLPCATSDGLQKTYEHRFVVFNEEFVECT